MPETTKLEFRIKLENKDFITFNLEYRRLFYLLFSCVYFLLAAVLFLLMNNDTPLTVFKGLFAVGVGVVAAAFIQLALFFTLRFQVSRMFKSDRLMQYEQHYILDDSGLVVLTQVGDSRISWPELYRVVEYRNSLALFVGRNRALILPKRLLDSQIANGTAEVKRLVKACLPPQKVKLRR